MAAQEILEFIQIDILDEKVGIIYDQVIDLVAYL